MGVSGTAIFSNDTALDVRDSYIENLENGMDDDKALKATLEEFKAYLDDPEERTVVLIALAVTQSKVGRLDPKICKNALAAIDSGEDIAFWEQDNPKLAPKRREVLLKARAQLTGEQPKRKRIKPPKKHICGLTVGDILSFKLPNKLLLFRVVYISVGRLGETPILEELSFSGALLPAQDKLARLKPQLKHFNIASKVHYFTVYANDKWDKAGFEKVYAGNLGTPLKTDPRTSDSGYMSWLYLADHVYEKRGK